MIFIHDLMYRKVSAPLTAIARESGIQIDTREIEYDGIKPLDPMTAQMIVGPEYDVILFGMVHNVWHTPERRRAKYELNKRMAALVCSAEDIGDGACLAGVLEIGAATRQLAQYFQSGMTVAVSTPSGSDFSAVIEKPFCEHGNYCLPGTGGDFPADEVGFGPRIGSVNGCIVYDVKLQHVGLLKEALRLQVQNDRILEVSGSAADRFRAICAQRGAILNYISEISVGLNPFSRVSPDPEYIPEEKTFGTLHCGHGGNGFLW